MSDCRGLIASLGDGSNVNPTRARLTVSFNANPTTDTPFVGAGGGPARFVIPRIETPVKAPGRTAQPHREVSQMAKPLRLKVISKSESDARGVIVADPNLEGELVRGIDRVQPDLECGQCGGIIAKSISRADLATRLKSTAMNCAGCNAINVFAL